MLSLITIFKSGTTIYFAVNFEALRNDITNDILPHFRGIAEGIPLITTLESIVHEVYALDWLKKVLLVACLLVLVVT
ncbi:glycoside hydrolase domain-containing protein [Polycladospora coralii]|uniref:glycoside hydrolase domain-containing protein n=1 Tax=Polycladospora coralii TaxID=2771432 RepID=UPI003F6F71BD